MFYSTIALGIGFILDLILGDPDYQWHPIRLIGRFIAYLEKKIRAIGLKTKKEEVLGGLILVLLVCFISLLAPMIMLWIAYKIHVISGIFVESIFCYQLLATKSLHDESMKVYKALQEDDIEVGKKAVSMIVGRDTQSLSREGIMKATVETIAENTSDGSIAPLFYLAIGGPVLGAVYKAVNTMDSMIGYKNQRYLHFGKVAAKLDDVLNFIPARLSALFMIAGTLLTKFNTKNAWKIYKRDRYCHASPNSAQTEAVVAGALGIKLAGDAYYFGELHQKPTIGDSLKEVECVDIIRANKLLYITAMIGILVFLIIRIIIVFQI